MTATAFGCLNDNVVVGKRGRERQRNDCCRKEGRVPLSPPPLAATMTATTIKSLSPCKVVHTSRSITKPDSGRGITQPRTLLFDHPYKINWVQALSKEKESHLQSWKHKSETSGLDAYSKSRPHPSSKRCQNDIKRRRRRRPR